MKEKPQLSDHLIEASSALQPAEEQSSVQEAPTARTPGRPKIVDPDQRRQDILHCAETLFIEKGYAQTTTTMIASAAKVSKRSLYEAFADKESIYKAVMTQNRLQMLDLPRPPDEDLPPLQALIKIFRLDMDDVEDHQREVFLRAVIKDVIEDSTLNDSLYKEGVFSYRELLIDWLQQQEAKGVFQLEDVCVCAGMLMDIVFGALTPRRRHYEDMELRKRHIIKALVIFLRGIGVSVASV